MTSKMTSRTQATSRQRKSSVKPKPESGTCSEDPPPAGTELVQIGGERVAFVVRFKANSPNTSNKRKKKSQSRPKTIVPRAELSGKAANGRKRKKELSPEELAAQDAQAEYDAEEGISCSDTGRRRNSSAAAPSQERPPGRWMKTHASGGQAINLSHPDLEGLDPDELLARQKGYSWVGVFASLHY